MGTSIELVDLVDDRYGEIGVSVVLTDDFYPHLRVRFTYDNDDGTLPLNSVSVERTNEEMDHQPEITVFQLRAEFPWAAWERAARVAAAEEFAERVGGLRPVGVDSREGSLFSSLLIDVAMDYRANVKAGLRNPAAVIAEKHGVKPATARSWIHRARGLGLLGPAKGTTAGEAGIATTQSERSANRRSKAAQGQESTRTSRNGTRTTKGQKKRKKKT
jgi:hypothetical protein